MVVQLKEGWYILHIAGNVSTLASEKPYSSFEEAKGAREGDPELRENFNTIARWDGQKWRDLRGV